MSNVFPTEILRPEHSVLCLFSAWYTGEHDVAFVKKAGCTDVLLVDLDSRRLQATSIMYDYQAKVCDAFDFITLSVASGRKWDVVITDQWSNQDQLINVEWLDRLKQICNKTLCLGYCKRWFGDKFFRPGRYVHRSDHLGGVYWRIIEL